MREPDSADYYRMREEQERSFATVAADPRAVAIHLNMAARYRSLAQGRPASSDHPVDRPTPAQAAAFAAAGGDLLGPPPL